MILKSDLRQKVPWKRLKMPPRFEMEDRKSWNTKFDARCNHVAALTNARRRVRSDSRLEGRAEMTVKYCRWIEKCAIFSNIDGTRCGRARVV